ncbi:MAG: 16S rRNA (cytosine(1402)-N(4))-methyltransferase RsmH [Patescibacteria group bacterium]
MKAIHEPVLLEEIVQYLSPKRGVHIIDATLNGGGHARALVQRGVTVLGIERDPEIVKIIKKEKITKLTVQEGNYIYMKEYVQKQKFQPVYGVLFDFGMSSYHVDQAGRGFSFTKDEPLDMRYDQDDGISAAEMINSYREAELANIFFAYGEERRGRAVARAIVNERRRSRIVTSGHLARLVESVIPRRGKVHPATKVFQALRIAVNKELECVEDGLRAAMDVIEVGGRVAAISFHSLEDRIVKHTFRSASNGMPITTKPVIASREEVLKNPRSRSAKLRVWERTV